MDKRIDVMTTGGMVSGICSGGYAEFKGIPFARAGRFKRPEPVRWEGVRDASVFGKKAMQVFGPPAAPWEKPQTRDEFDEDCLNLNIYVPESFVILPENSRENGSIPAIRPTSCPAIRPAKTAGHGTASENGGGLPVLVEVHGGAFQNGSNQEHLPAQIIRDQRLIYVSVNYRIGVFGFLYLDGLGEKEEKGGNKQADAAPETTCREHAPEARCTDAALEIDIRIGLMDLMASIRWIYENISAFGGDPERMTLMGSSAGAKAIAALMCTPKLKRYVHRVILSSGATQSIRDKKTAGIIANRFMDQLCQILENQPSADGGAKDSREGKAGCLPPDGSKRLTIRELMELPADILIEAQKRLCDNPGNTCMFGPVADGIFLPENASEIAARGTLWEGSAMIGSSMHELGFYKMLNPDFAPKAPEIAKFLFGKNASVARADFKRLCDEYTSEHGCEPSGEQMSDIWVRILTDYMYRTYSYRLARRLAARGSKVWQYSVAFEPALHCFDQSLAFAKPLPVFFNGQEHMAKAKALGQEIYKSFIQFITSGDPNGAASSAASGVTENGSAASSAASGVMAAGSYDTSSVKSAIRRWPCLTAESPVQMVWDEHSCVCPVTRDDVLEGIGEAVFVL